MAISTPTPTWIDSARTEYANSPRLHKLMEQYKQGELDLTLYTCHDRLLFCKEFIRLCFSYSQHHLEATT